MERLAEICLNPSEKYVFAEVLKFKAINENSVWHIDGEPTDDTVKVIDALFEQKRVSLIPKS